MYLKDKRDREAKRRELRKKAKLATTDQPTATANETEQTHLRGGAGTSGDNMFTNLPDSIRIVAHEEGETEALKKMAKIHGMNVNQLLLLTHKAATYLNKKKETGTAAPQATTSTITDQPASLAALPPTTTSVTT